MNISSRTVRTRTFVLSLLSILLVTAGGHAGQAPRALTVLHQALEGQAEFVSYLRIDRALPDGFFQLLPLGDSVQAVVAEDLTRLLKESKAPAFDLDDLRGVSIAFGHGGRSAKATCAIYVECSSRVVRWIQESGRAKPASKPSTSGAQAEEETSGAICFTSEGFVVTEADRPLGTRERDPVPDRLDRIMELCRGLSGDTRFLVAGPNCDQLRDCATGPFDSLKAAQWFAFAIDSERMTFRIEFDSAKHAQETLDRVDALIQLVMTQLRRACSNPAREDPADEFPELERWLMRVRHESVRRFAQAVGRTRTDRAVSLTVARDALPSSMLSTGLLAGHWYLGLVLALLRPDPIDPADVARWSGLQQLCFLRQSQIELALAREEAARCSPWAARRDLSVAFLDELVARGYLEARPQDPGTTLAPLNYRLSSDGRVNCTVHGTRKAPAPYLPKGLDPEASQLTRLDRLLNEQVRLMKTRPESRH